jgi:hypothetical protein
MKVPVEYFPVVDGSMTSDDGESFFYKVQRQDGSAVMLGFPHDQVGNLIENAAMQMQNGRSEGEKLATAFITAGFLLGRGQNGEIVLMLEIGKTGRMSFLLPEGMPAELEAALAETLTKH